MIPDPHLQRRIPLAIVITSSVSYALMRGQIEFFEKNGFEVSLISGAGAGPEIRQPAASHVYVVPMVREISPWADAVSLFHLWRLLRGIRPALAVVSTPKAGLLGGLAARLAGVPCRIYLLRGLRLECATGMKRRILGVTERIAAACAHEIICVSRSLKAAAVRAGVAAESKMKVLGSGSSNGIDTVRFAPRSNLLEKKTLQTSLGLGGNEPVIGFVGRFTNDKGIATLVRAFGLAKQRHPDLKLLLIGDFETGDPVDEQTRNVILQDPNIVRPGFVSDTAPYYQLMDILVLPTRREGFPQVALEAQSSGVPVITTNSTGAVDSVLDGTTGLIVPADDAGALSEAIEKMLADPQQRTRFGGAARERILKEFSNQQVWGALLNEFRDMLVRKSDLHGMAVVDLIASEPAVDDRTDARDLRDRGITTETPNLTRAE